MRRLMLAVLLAGCAATPASPPFDAAIVVMEPSIAEHLRDVQRHFEKESAFCLGGAITDPFVVISWMKVARTRFRTSTMVGYADCNDSDFIGIAHSHPPGYGCAFSPQDLTTFAQSARSIIDVVAGDDGCILVRTRDGKEVKLK